MAGISIWQLLILGILFFLIVVPTYMAITSQKASILQKVIWCALTIWLSWLGYFLFYFIFVKEKAID